MYPPYQHQHQHQQQQQQQQQHHPYQQSQQQQQRTQGGGGGGGGGGGQQGNINIKDNDLDISGLSKIRFKLKSVKAQETITFEGPAISVHDLKRLIIQKKKLRGQDADIILRNSDTQEEYTLDKAYIPRGTDILVSYRTIINFGPHGGMDRYVDDDNAAAAAEATLLLQQQQQQQQQQQMQLDGTASGPTSALPGSADAADVAQGELSEDASIQRMMEQNEEYWRNNPQAPTFYQRGGRGGRGGGFGGPGRDGFVTNRKLPPTYRCHRCGQGGHWINNCPTNVDLKFDLPKLKPTTGIPSSFLRAAEIKDEDLKKGSRGLMVGLNGEILKAHSNEQEWQKLASLTAAASRAMQEMAPPDPELLCSICHKLMREAVITPCCSASFCDECVRKPIIEKGDLKCPSCKRDELSIDLLKPNQMIRQRITDYQRQITNKGKGKEPERPSQQSQSFQQSLAPSHRGGIPTQQPYHPSQQPASAPVAKFVGSVSMPKELASQRSGAPSPPPAASDHKTSRSPSPHLGTKRHAPSRAVSPDTTTKRPKTDSTSPPPAHPTQPVPLLASRSEPHIDEHTTSPVDNNNKNTSPGEASADEGVVETKPSGRTTRARAVKKVAATQPPPREDAPEPRRGRSRAVTKK